MSWLNWTTSIARATRLRHKFEWVAGTEYREDRQLKRYELHGEARSQALDAFSFLVAYADEQELNLSREDLKTLAVGFVKGIPVVTDDISMGKEIGRASCRERV